MTPDVGGLECHSNEPEPDQDRVAPRWFRLAGATRGLGSDRAGPVGTAFSVVVDRHHVIGVRRSHWSPWMSFLMYVGVLLALVFIWYSGEIAEAYRGENLRGQLTKPGKVLPSIGTRNASCMNA